MRVVAIARSWNKPHPSIRCFTTFRSYSGCSGDFKSGKLFFYRSYTFRRVQGHVHANEGHSLGKGRSGFCLIYCFANPVKAPKMVEQQERTEGWASWTGKKGGRIWPI